MTDADCTEMCLIMIKSSIRETVCDENTLYIP